VGFLVIKESLLRGTFGLCHRSFPTGRQATGGGRWVTWYSNLFFLFHGSQIFTKFSLAINVEAKIVYTFLVVQLSPLGGKFFLEQESNP
jgi:hypothetical protein